VITAIAIRLNFWEPRDDQEYVRQKRMHDVGFRKPSIISELHFEDNSQILTALQSDRMAVSII
jgi:hypothetical protein